MTNSIQHMNNAPATPGEYKGRIRRLTGGLYFPVLFLLLFMSLNTFAQAPVAMDKGLSNTVECGCIDSSGRLYALTDNVDSVVVNRWDTTTRKWSVYALLNRGFQKNRRSKATCNFLNNALIVTGISEDNSHTAIYEYKNGAWKKLTKMRHNFQSMMFGRLSAFKFQNKLYFVASTDSFINSDTVGVIVYDGVNFAGAGLKVDLSDVKLDFGFASISDTLFLSFGSSVYAYKGGVWKLHYKMPEPGFIRSIAGLGSSLYVSEFLSPSAKVKIKKLRQGIQLDSFSIAYNKYAGTADLFTAGSRVLVSGNQYYYNMLHSFDNTHKVQAHFRNVVIDTNGLRFIVNGNKVYCFARGGVKVNGLDYRHIAEIKLPALRDIKQDTIRLHVFRDVNQNGTYEQTDELATRAIVKEIYTDEVYNTDSSGRIELYPLDNEDFKVLFLSNTFDDSCYESPYSGAQSSGHYNSPVGVYQMEMPIWKTRKTNVVLKSYSNIEARLDTEQPLDVLIYKRDCDFTTTAIIVNIDLEDSTQFVSSVPSYSSKSGNRLTYALKITGYTDQYIHLRVKYPLGHFQLGDTARHHAWFTTGSKEDTSDNSDMLETRIVYSYDPNSKHSEPEGKITSDLKSIRYHINFQNEGSDDAWRVTVVDTLNLKMPVYEFRMLGTSHPYIISHKDNVVTWVFDNIMLKPKSKDEEGSKGFLVFEAKVRGDLRQGDSIRNKAYIYFDYNQPIVTNYAVVQRSDKDGGINGTAYTLANLGVYPNPAGDHITLHNRSRTDQYIYIYDMKGALVSGMNLKGSSKKELDTAEWATGIYMVRGSSGDAIKVIIE